MTELNSSPTVQSTPLHYSPAIKSIPNCVYIAILQISPIHQTNHHFIRASSHLLARFSYSLTNALGTAFSGSHVSSSDPHPLQ